MTSMQITPSLAVAKELLSGNPDGLKELVRAILQEVLEAEMTKTIGAAKGETNGERRGYRSGSYPRTVVSRVGKIELRVPQDREGRFSTELFQRYQRSEQALVSSLAQMYVQGVSTRKVKAINEELCGHAFSASASCRRSLALQVRESLPSPASLPLALAHTSSGGRVSASSRAPRSDHRCAIHRVA